MDKQGHVLNGLLLGIGLGYVLFPAGNLQTLYAVVQVTLPVTLGALFPDVDTAFGKHRKTLHNLPVLALFIAFPIYFDNLQYVWIGVLTHYVLDVFGSKRGIAVFYPLWSEEFGSPTGVTTSSKYAIAVTLVITALELGIAVLLVHVVPGTIEGIVGALPYSDIEAVVNMR